MNVIKVRFSDTIYSENAVLEAVHEVSSEFPSVVEHVDSHYEVTVSDLRDIEQEASIRLWLMQLVNDGEIRIRLESSHGRVRDVVIAAAFSQIAVDQSVADLEKAEGVE
jgi:His-Xaa-Ser system protein HxsD